MIAMPKLIPASVWGALSLAIAKGETDQVKHLVEQHNIDVNAFVDSGSWMPVLMEALLSYGFDSEEARLPLLKYLLDKGADPNIRCRRGYNCLHIAVQQERYIKALDLFLDYKADVNVGDEDNSNVVYWAVQGWLLRKTSEDRQEHLRVFDKILRLGADLDQENRYGMCARKWLEGAAPDVRERVARWEASNSAKKGNRSCMADTAWVENRPEYCFSRRSSASGTLSSSSSVDPGIANCLSATPKIYAGFVDVFSKDTLS